MQPKWILPLALLLMQGAGRAQELKPALPGMEILTAKCASAAKGPVTLDGVRVDPAVLMLKLLDTYSVLRKSQAFTSFSLRDLAWKVKPLAIINGGPTGSFSSPVPVGLMLSEGRIISKALPSSKTLTGALCSTGLSAIVMPIASHRLPECRWALQAGPMLVVDGRNVINETELSNRPAYRRSIAAVDRRGRVLLVATSEVHLHALAGCLTGELKQLEVREAINLDGDASSGLLVATPGGQTREFGNSFSLIASAIAVVPRGR